MTWEWYASVLQVLCMVFGDVRPKLEVQMHVSYADFYSIMDKVARPAMPCRTRK
jgi:hypothetical protein